MNTTLPKAVAYDVHSRANRVTQEESRPGCDEAAPKTSNRTVTQLNTRVAARKRRGDELTPLHECTFYAVARKQGRWVGKCREYPKLSTRPMVGKLNALDAIISLVSERLRDIDLQQRDEGR